ncbi:MAG: hypothetical protein AAB570_04150 [Patescibacteria group bacterium]
MSVAIKKLPKSRELLSRAWSAYTKNWLAFWKYILPLVLGTIVVQIMMAYEATILVGGVLYIAIMVYALWMTVVITRISYQTMEGKAVNEAKAKENAWNRFWPLLGVGIITTLITFFGLMFFIVPGFILILMYFSAQYGVIIDNQKVHEAIYKSVGLAAGRKANMFWTLLWALLLLILVAFIIFVILSVILGALQTTTQADLLTTGNSIILLIAEYLVIPWSSGVGTGMYLALKKA